MLSETRSMAVSAEAKAKAKRQVYHLPDMYRLSLRATITRCRASRLVLAHQKLITVLPEWSEEGGYPDTEDLCMVRVQIEFYFSDSNLPRDVFMAERIAEHPEVWSLPR